MQDEFKFYLEDASSKLLVVPVGGHRAAEAAAADLGVPVASFSIPRGARAAFFYASMFLQLHQAPVLVV